MGKLLNLLYVAVTRARAELSIPEGVKELLAGYASYRDDYVELVGRVL